MTPVITVENLGKRYRIGRAVQRPKNLREALCRLPLSPFQYLQRKMTGATDAEILWALKDVTFEVRQGEVLGIIGRNGAGKSTLLKILSRITDPTEGRAIIRGRVNSLLEVGTGFHPELTGRENIYMNAAMHGMRRAEITRKLDEIIAFAEVERFVDTPVKRYSSGMYTRLAFAVAAHLDPDILLVDEVLAVGDVSFQRKCLGKMEDVAREGRTVFFVSHQMPAVENLTTRAILFEKGRLSEDGPTKDVIQRYLRSVAGEIEATSLWDRKDRVGTGEYRFSKVWLTGPDGQEVPSFRPGDRSTIHAVVEPSGVPRRVAAVATVCFRDQTGYRLFTTAASIAGVVLDVDGRTEIRWTIPKMPLTVGRYRCDVMLSPASGGEYLDYMLDAFELEVIPGDFFGSGREQGAGLDRMYVDFSVEAVRLG